MDTVLKWMNAGAVPALVVLCFWLLKLLRAHRDLIGAQKEVVDSFRSSADYVQSIHTTVRNLYDPKAIGDIITARTERVIEDVKRQLQEAESGKEKREALINTLSVDRIIAETVAHIVLRELPDEKIHEMELAVDRVGKTSGADVGARIRRFIDDWRRREADAKEKALRRIGKSHEQSP